MLAPGGDGDDNETYDFDDKHDEGYMDMMVVMVI